MGVFDQAARYATETEPEAVVRRTLRGSPALRFRAWRDTRTTPRPGDPDRTADRVAELVDDAAPDHPWLLVFEFQARHDPDKLDVTLVEAGQLRLRCRHGDDRLGKYKVLAALVYLRGDCPESVLDMTLPGGLGTSHRPVLWIIQEDGAREALEAVAAGLESWGLLFWVPLMSGGGDPDLVQRWKDLAAAVPDHRRRGDLGQIVLVFAELAGCAPAWKDGLEGWDMTESQYVNGLIQGACERTRLEEKRDSLLRVVRQRFPALLTPDVLATIDAQPSLSILNDWFDVAIGAFTPDVFLAALRR